MTQKQTKKTLTKGDILFKEGDRGGYAYFIESGEVEILKNLGLPDEKVIQKVGKGQLVGEMAVLDDQPRSASARVISDAQVMELDKASFLARVTKDPSAAMKIIKTLSDRLRSTSTANNKAENRTQEVVVDETFNHLPLSHASVTTDNFDRKTVMAAVWLCGTVLVAICGSMLIEVKTTVSAFAKVVPATPNLTIEAGAEGVLKEVLISEGDIVEKGQVIAYMDVSATEAEIKSLASEQSAAQTRLSRLKQERDIIDTGGILDLSTIKDDVLHSRLSHFQSKLSVFDQKLASAEREYEISKRQSAMTTEKDVESGIISQMDYLDSQASLNNALAEVAKLKAERHDFVTEWHADIEKQLEADTALEKTLSAQLERLEVDRLSLTVRSPVAGRILEVKARREGTVLSKGHPIAEITRAGEVLVVEAEVPPKDVKALRTGLDVSFKLDALPFQRYGDMKGKIIRVDEDAIPSRRPGVEDEFYMVRIELQEAVPKRAPKDFSMRRGSTGKADMITGDRTIFSYLLDPLMGAMRTAFREG